MTLAERWLVADTADLVPPLIERIASRLVEAIELDELSRADGAEQGDRASASLAADARRQQLLVGAWLSEELATINQIRLAGGERPLDPNSDRAVRAASSPTSRVPARSSRTSTTRPSRRSTSTRPSTWVTYVDGRKVDVGSSGTSADELTAFQKRLALSDARTGEGRLDTSSPMLTFQAIDGSRVVMVLGGPASTACPRTADRHPSLRRPPRSGSRVWPTSACSRTSGAAAASDGALRLHDPRVRATGRRQDDAAHGAAR